MQKSNKKTTDKLLEGAWSVIEIPTKGNTLSLHDKPIVYRKNNTEYYANYENTNNSLILFSLKDSSFYNRIEFFNSGPNKISGLNTFNFWKDTIISQNLDNISFIDSNGIIKKRLTLNNIYPEIDDNYCLKGDVRISISNLKRLHLNNKNQNIVLRLYNKEDGYNDIYKEPKFLEFNIATGEAIAHPVIFPDEIQKRFYGDLEYPNIISKGDSIIYNFPFKAAVYIYNKHTKQTVVKKFNANYIPNVAKGADLSEKNNLRILYPLIQGDVFHQIDYNPNKDLYFMLYSEAKVEHEPRQRHLIVFDNNIDKIGEIQMPTDLSPNFAISRKGLLFRNVNEDSFDTLTLHVLNVEVEQQ